MIYPFNLSVHLSEIKTSPTRFYLSDKLFTWHHCLLYISQTPPPTTHPPHHNTTTPQPTQIDFENNVAIVLLKAEAAGYKTIVVEDESRNVGSLHVPFNLHGKMSASPMVNLIVSDEDRIAITVQEYAKDIHLEYVAQFGDAEGLKKLQTHLLESLSKLHKRLGGERYARMQQAMRDAVTLLDEKADYTAFGSVFGELLLDYYDPMYDYQMSSKKERIVYNGSREDVLQHLISNYGSWVTF